MRVLVVTNQYPVSRRPNYGVFVAEQVRSLRALGLRVDVLFLNAKRTRLNYAFGFPRVVRALRSGRYDVVHTHHTYSMLLIGLARRVAGLRVPVVLTNHEGEITDHLRRARTVHPTSRLRYWLTLKRYAASKADFVIFVSSKMADVISTTTPWTVIPCGVDLVKFRPLDPSQCRMQLGLLRRDVVVFFPAGPAAEGKWFDLARDAYASFRTRVPRSLLITAGNIPHAEMPTYYNAADVVIQASLYEASPTVVKEALACEAPLVSTDSGDTREIIDGIPNCRISPDDPDVFAARMAACLGGRASGGRERLRAKGLSLEQVARRVAEVYQAVHR